MFLILKPHVCCICCIYVYFISFALSFCEIHFLTNSTSAFSWAPTNELGAVLSSPAWEAHFSVKEVSWLADIWEWDSVTIAWTTLSLCNITSLRIIPVPPTFWSRVFLDSLRDKWHFFFLFCCLPFVFTWQQITKIINYFYLCFFLRWSKQLVFIWVQIPIFIVHYHM